MHGNDVLHLATYFAQKAQLCSCDDLYLNNVEVLLANSRGNHLLTTADSHRLWGQASADSDLLLEPPLRLLGWGVGCMPAKEAMAMSMRCSNSACLLHDLSHRKWEQ